MNLESQLTQLETAQLVRHLVEDEPAFIFKHALTQEAAYDSLLLKTRRELHRSVAETYEKFHAQELDEFAALIAYHFAKAGDDAKAFEYATRAGDVAARLFAYSEARAHYALALEAIARLPDDDDNHRRRADALIKQVTVSLRSAGPTETLKVLSEAEALAQPFAERADATRQDRVRLARINFWQGHALLHSGDSPASVEKMRAVMKVAAAENEPPLLAVSASVIGRSLVLSGRFAQGIPVLSDAINALEQIHDEHEWIFSVGLRGFAILMRGEVAQGMAEAERTIVRANQAGTLTGMSVAHFILALTHLFGDSISAALEHSRAVIETSARSGDRLHAFAGHGYLAWAQTRSNQLDEAEKSFAQADAIAQAMGGRLVFSDWFMVVRAELYFRRGEYAQVIALMQEGIALSQKSGGILFTGLAHRLSAQALAKSAPENWGEIENHLTASLRLFDEGDAKIEIARTRFVWGKLLMGRDDSVSRLRAREMFEQAAAQFEASGLQRELKETHELMASEPIKN